MIPVTQELKTWPKYFEAILSGSKRFEIRRNDRPFMVGQTLILREFDPEDQTYTGRAVAAQITYMTDFEQKPGFVVLGIGSPHIAPTRLASTQPENKP